MSDTIDAEPLGHHLVIKLADNRIIAKDDAERRIIANNVLALSHRHNLLAFGLIDTHLHIHNAEDWQKSGLFAHRVETSLHHALKLKVSFRPVSRTVINKLGHHYSTFRYNLMQPDRHGVTTDPLHEASNLPDLLELRLVGRHTIDNQKAQLPRVTDADLLEWLGINGLDADADVPYDPIAQAVMSAACLSELKGHEARKVEAKIAAVHAARGRLKDGDLGARIQLSERRIREIRADRSPDEDLVKAIRLQLHLRHLKREELKRPRPPRSEKSWWPSAA